MIAVIKSNKHLAAVGGVSVLGFGVVILGSSEGDLTRTLAKTEGTGA